MKRKYSFAKAAYDGFYWVESAEARIKHPLFTFSLNEIGFTKLNENVT